jgi:hypothetical protein
MKGKGDRHSVRVGNVTGEVVTIAGGDPTVNVTRSGSISFAPVEEMLRSRSADPELYAAVRQIEGEVARGERADSRAIHRCLAVLRDRAPDILSATLAILTASGVAERIRVAAQTWL